MSIINYLFIGVVFMVIVEYLLNRSDIQKHMTVEPELDILQRVIGVIFWPICLSVFLYNFFKQFFK